MKNLYVLFFCYIICITYAFGQTCCSGGVPVSNNLGFQSAESGFLQYSLAVNHNQLNSLFSESNRLDDDSRLRTTQTFIIRSAYQINPRFSAELFVPFIRQTRQITQSSFGSTDLERTNGLGDIIVLGSYELVQSKLSWILSAGLKLATGKNNVTNSNGLTLVNDLQPGSNATDFIFKSSLSGNLSKRPTTTIFGSLTYSLKGHNNNYLGSLSYKFGNEATAIIGIQDQWLLGTNIFNPGIGLRYRKAERDLVNSSELESTGGEWLFSQFNLGYKINPQSQFLISFEIPVYSFVNGTQLSPNYTVNFSFYSKFKINRNEK